MKEITKLLIDKRNLLNEYFSISITEDGKLVGIPVLLQDYIPNAAQLPRFILGLGTNVYNL
jgi:DNA mismatch repair protein MLH1